MTYGPRGVALAIARSTAPSRFLSALVLSAVHSYLAMVPICGIAAYVLVLLLGNPGANDVGMFVVLFAIWFPLWLAPGVGALWAARRISAGWRPQAACAGGSVVGRGLEKGVRRYAPLVDLRCIPGLRCPPWPSPPSAGRRFVQRSHPPIRSGSSSFA